MIALIPGIAFIALGAIALIGSISTAIRQRKIEQQKAARKAEAAAKREAAKAAKAAKQQSTQNAQQITFDI